MAVQSLDPRESSPLAPSSPVIEPGHTYGTINDKISSVVFRSTPMAWFIATGVAFMGVMLFLYAVTILFVRGVGIWGINIPVGWGFDIINFVWWIGIGHAGTLISAVLLLTRQNWRTSINRFAEAMTLFAVVCAGMYPILHLGRPWVFYWLFPYPYTLGAWPQFNSPLLWDVFAISTYATVSLLFWYTGLIPDLATMRDKSKTWLGRTLYGIFALGWRGSARHWGRYEMAYLLLAGLSTPLVVSVHSVVSLDFAAGVVPGWQVTVFPPYFVAGAIFSGFAMVLTLAIPLRYLYRLQDLITLRHLEMMAKVMLATGMIVSFGYFLEVFYGWYSANTYEVYLTQNRMVGPYAWSYWALWACNALSIQLLWFKRIRTNIPILFVLSIVVNVGMWLERFVIIVTALHRDFLPSSWGMYYPTAWDWATYVGTMGLFLFLMFLFVRFVPMIAIAEMQVELKKDQLGPGHAAGGHSHDGHGHDHNAQARAGMPEPKTSKA
jgi:Ni/Fe-hydrogenase subunit HybB-like protein